MYVVIFKTLRELPVSNDYMDISQELSELIKHYDGFLGIETVVDQNGKGVSISYWKSLEDIDKWKADRAHLKAQELGKKKWYLDSQVEVCQILRSYEKPS